MMGKPLGASFDLEMRNGDCTMEDELHHRYRSSWYFSKEEIEKNSPSRKDGIDLTKESQLRTLYCSFLWDIGIRLGLPHVTIATATMFCHRFYLHQSHAKNEWQTVATACIFLAAKVEDTPCGLDKIVVVSYGTMYRRDPAAARRIRQKDIFEKQKALVLIGERLLLSTIRFDFNILHPYKPLLDALKKLGITRKEVRQAAWNYVNDWLRTTLCLQYKPHYIAAGSLFLAARLHNVKLPSERGYVWWHEFDVNPRQLEVVIHQMMHLVGFNRRSSKTSLQKPVQAPIAACKEIASSPDSVLNRSDSSRSSSSKETGLDLSSHKPLDSTEHVLTNILSGDCGGPPSTITQKKNISRAEVEQSLVQDRTDPRCLAMDFEVRTADVKFSEILERNVDHARTKHDQSHEELGKIDTNGIKATIKKRKRER